MQSVRPFDGATASDNRKTYPVIRTGRAWAPTGQWDHPFWRDVAPLDVGLYMGAKPEHIPRTQAKLAYDEQGIYVIFRVEDRYVRAVAKKFLDPVCRDSCVEFFVTPSQEIANGYINIEVNCKGVLLSRHQFKRGAGTALDPKDCERFLIHTSLGRGVIEPEIADPMTWTAEYRVPFDVLEKYTPVIRPAAGVVWRANLYKCADDSSHPHWLTWSPVGNPTPDFHLPAFFGVLAFQ